MGISRHPLTRRGDGTMQVPPPHRWHPEHFIMRKAIEVTRTGAVTLLVSLPMSFIVLVWAFVPPKLGTAYEIMFVFCAGFFLRRHFHQATKLADGAVVALSTGMCLIGISMCEHHWLPLKHLAFLDSATNSPWGVLSFMLAVGVGGPLLEEALFRDYLLSRLRKNLSGPTSVVVSSMIFTLAHADTTRAAEQFAAGIILAGIVVVTGRLWPAIAAHSACNLCGFMEAAAHMVKLPDKIGVLYPISGALISVMAGSILFRTLMRTDWNGASVAQVNELPATSSSLVGV